MSYKLVLLDGFTGTAKTEILKDVARQGGQVLDLEGMAGHRGSLLGEMPGGQPSQKAFESRIACALAGFDPARPVLVEAEANKIGARIIPPTVWEAMKQAPRLDIEAGFTARCDYLLRAYEDILANGAKMSEKLDQLRAHRSNALVDQWQALIAEGDKAALTASLMCDHYDPAYQKARGRYEVRSLGTVTAQSLDADGIAAAAAQVLTRLERFSAE